MRNRMSPATVSKLASRGRGQRSQDVFYADGCQTQKFDVVVKMTAEDRDFDCEPLPTVTLRGVIALLVLDEKLVGPRDFVGLPFRPVREQ